MFPQTIIFIGPQGSGKGTQIARVDTFLRKLDPETKVVDIQSGRRFRSFARIESGFTAEHIGATLDTGELQPLFLSVALWGYEMVQQMDDVCHVLIDGFPRTVEEAIVLETAFSLYKRTEVSIVFLDTPEQVVRERMKMRARSDDTPDSIEARLRWYYDKTLPVIEHYKARPQTRLHIIDGTRSVDEVTEQIIESLQLKHDTEEK